jgi:hypothetical protein
MLLEDDPEEFLEYDGGGGLVTQSVPNFFGELVEAGEVRFRRELRVLFPRHEERQTPEVEFGVGPGCLSGELLPGR